MKNHRSIAGAAVCLVDTAELRRLVVNHRWDSAAPAMAAIVMESLRGHTTGLAVPTCLVDAPGGKTFPAS